MTHTTKTDSKEVLHTQGQWVLSNDNTRQHWSIFNKDHTKRIASISHEPNTKRAEHTANAELIVKAVNNYQKLLDSNRELSAALKKALIFINAKGGMSARERDEITQTIHDTLTIHNAKNLK